MRQLVIAGSLPLILIVFACQSQKSGEEMRVGTPAHAAAAVPAGSLARTVNIPFEKFTLGNGLTLLVHEDHKAPIVAVNVWYHVGSKNEKPGKTGFAHLFEHLMFQGSENFHGEFFDPMTKAGATNMNGTTNSDRTNYFENVPKNALDMVLWMESDRMGHLLGAIDQLKLDEQRGVVQNEKRQGENQPYGQSFNLITAGTAPTGHPYSWTTIGSMDDLNAASLDDVKEWFRTYYGAANAVLSIAGDVKAEEVRAKVEQYFGDIPSGPPVARMKEWVPRMTETKRQVMEDRVAQPRLSMVWNVAPWGDPSLDVLSLFADVLAGGKTSHLYQRLVVKEQLATDCRANVMRRELGSQFMISATAKPGVDLAQVEAIVEEELAALCAEGPTADELARVKSQQLAGFVRGLERIGGFGGKSDTLAEGEVYGGDPVFYKQRIMNIEAATVADVRAAADADLGGTSNAAGRYILHVVPFPKYQTTAAAADRSKLPDTGTTAEAQFPAFTRRKLANGLEMIVVERHAVPTVEMQLLIAGGDAADPETATGLSAMTLNLMDEGTKTRTAVQIAEELEKLGARLGTGSNQDGASISLSSLKSNLDRSLELFADVVLHPSFPSADFERIRKESLVRLQAAKVEPNGMARRVMPLLVYGKGHPYGRLGAGQGTESSLQSLTTQQLAQFHATWFKPNHAKLLVVGDTTADEIAAKIEARFAGWKSGDVPKVALQAPTTPVAKPVVYLMDRPQATQSVITVAMVAPPTGGANDIAIDAMNDVFGGQFTARINMNLREDKHWSYGARSSIGNARGPRAFVVSAPVQTDKTKESMAEVQKELTEILAARPVTDDELNLVKSNSTKSLSGRWETNNAVLGSLAEIVQYGLPDTFWATYAGNVRGLTLAAVAAAAKDVVEPDHTVWIVVGDRARIEAGVREAGIGEVRVIDADGRPAEPTARP